MKKIILISIILFFVFADFSFAQISENANNKIANNKINTDSISFTTFRTGITFGYDIFLNGKLYIHQPNIPAVSGNAGFQTEENARKIAELVIVKIKHNIIPPTVIVNELDSLGVKY